MYRELPIGITATENSNVLKFLKELLPASSEVTFIPLVLSYVLFVEFLLYVPRFAVVVPALYSAMCAFFIVLDAFDGMRIRLAIGKAFFVMACVSPMLIAGCHPQSALAKPVARASAKALELEGASPFQVVVTGLNVDGNCVSSEERWRAIKDK